MREYLNLETINGSRSGRSFIVPSQLKPMGIAAKPAFGHQWLGPASVSEVNL